MKKTILMLSVVLATSVFFSSCKKGCYICTKGLDVEDVCEDDFDDYDKQGKAFKAALNLYEADGYKCKKD